MKHMLSHYSGESFDFDRSYIYDSTKNPWKPVGLWVSVDGEYDWPEWCHDREFNIENLSHRYRVRLVQNASVLYISSYEEIKELSARYPYSPPYDRSPVFKQPNWQAIREEYGGIIISPHSWEAHVDFLWYNGWDCASGCIWDLSLIESMNLLVDCVRVD